MRQQFAFSAMLFVAVAGAMAAGYGCTATRGSRGFGNQGGGGQGGDTSSGSSSSGQGGCLFNCGSGGAGQGGGGPAGVILINPPSAMLNIVDNNIPTQGFTATLNGQDVTTQVGWFYEKPNIGDLDASHTFVPTGAVAGQANLVAQLGNAQGQAPITVTIVKHVNTGGLTQQQMDSLDNPQGGADPALNILYPFNETVFPLSVLSPEIMWNGGQGGDVYKIQLKEQYYEFNEYFSAPPPSRHILPETDWANFESSGAGAQSDPVQVRLNRMYNGQAFAPTTQTWHIAQGKLKGSVYYWELPDACGNGNGRILRIKPDSPSVDQFYPTGQCYGCHTVSRDGKTMLATFEGGSPFPMQTLDLTQNPAVIGQINQAKGIGGTFAAFNNTGDKLIYSIDGSGAQLRIADANTGVILNNNVIPQSNCGEAAWSPDGKKIAAICDLSSYGWIFDAFGGNLAIADVDANGTGVTNLSTIVPQAGGQGRPAYPSFSPGSEWIAFGRPTTGSRSTGSGDLWLVAPDGSGLKKLQQASPENKSFNPVFAPLRAGGYFWLVYISRRDYGNRLVNAGRQQLWITAINDPPSAADPSNPPFYVRGQEDCGKSENAYYALDPCKEKGEGPCADGADCCSGTCIKDPVTMQYICTDPPMGGCSQNGNACKSDADCCDPSAQCVDGFCTPDIPQ